MSQPTFQAPLALHHSQSTQAEPARGPTTSASAAPHCQRSKVSSAAKGSTDGAVSCAPKQRKKKKMETSLPCGTTTACKTQSAGRRMVTQGGLFRKARGVCRTFDKPACTPSTSAVAAPVRKTAPQRTTTTPQRSKEADHKPSAVQADCDRVSAATHEGTYAEGLIANHRSPTHPTPNGSRPEWDSIHTSLHHTALLNESCILAIASSHTWTKSSAPHSLLVAVAPPPVDGAAPGQSALSRDIAELQEICEKLATTRTRTRQQASRGLMTGMSPVSGSWPDLWARMALAAHQSTCSTGLVKLVWCTACTPILAGRQAGTCGVCHVQCFCLCCIGSVPLPPCSLLPFSSLLHRFELGRRETRESLRS